jgi:hypothetical protein
MKKIVFGYLFDVDMSEPSAYTQAVTPTKALRIFFDQNEDLRPFATQKGFADLIGRSESMIRAMEGSRGVKMSPTLARRISTLTGVSQEWLMAPEAAGIDIPSFEGQPLGHMTVIARINGQLDRNLKLVGKNFEGDPAEIAHPPSEDSRSTQNRRLAAVTTKLMEKVLFASLERGESGLMDELMKLLDHDFSSTAAVARYPGDGPDDDANPRGI